MKKTALLAGLLLASTVFAQGPAPGAAPPAPPVAITNVSGPEDSRWTRTIERVASGIVTIQIDQVRAFDTEWNSTGQATGFVVDAERGLILTNRHVVTPGPVTAQAVFLNREEVTLYPVYRDPVHDFGFYRYDPSKLRFIKPAELKLHPEGAQVGREIRVVGNDAGEQLSILAGTLAKLDREAPQYGVGKYNDFNTFYYQAASSTSGGSSGSPVLDIDGRVLALNAGGASGAASSFYLPLDRITRALNLIQQGKPVPRGTLQTVFRYTPFDELARLGLKPETEAEVRKAEPRRTGMLVVREVQPGSMAEGVLEPGDILIRLDGKLADNFEPLSQVLDDKVGKNVTIEVQRGGVTSSRELPVQSLDQITPDEYLELGDGVVHTLSWQQARHLNSPISGVYVANPGYVLGSAGIPRGAVITEFNGKPTAALADFETILREVKDGEQVSARFVTIEDPRATQLRVIRMDRRWFAIRHCHRDDKLGVWPCDEWANDGVAEAKVPAGTRFATTDDPIIDKLTASLVMVDFDMPYSVAGITDRNYHGTGLIVDAARGLVLVDRNTVPVSLGDVRLTFAGTLEVPGRVVYVHPIHNFAVVSYDPKLIGDTPVKAAVLRARELKPGEQVWAVGLNTDSVVQSQAATVASVDAVEFPLSRTLRFRDANLETVRLINGPGEYDGVLANKQGEVMATWSSFSYEAGRDLRQDNSGIPIDLVLEMLPLVQQGKPLYSLETELGPVSLASARSLGLSDDWISRIEQHSPARRQILGVVRTVAGSAAAKVLRPGDLVLAVDDVVVNRFREVERATQKQKIRLSILRDGKEQTLEIDTMPLLGEDLDRIVVWAGATLHMPHRAMAAQRGIPPTGVFVAYFSYGSPSTRNQLWAGRRIVEVDGQPTPDLDAFLKTVSGREDRTSLRLRTVAWNGAVEVITLKLDKRYWPAYELRKTAGGWERMALE